VCELSTRVQIYVEIEAFHNAVNNNDFAYFSNMNRCEDFNCIWQCYVKCEKI
jgi:hypothetical protein